MGLAGRKVKQRIGSDPRNLSWADDADKFGAAYLSKLGWSAGSGLGADGEGRTSHIKVNQKLDMLGIGAAHQNDPNGIAWKQNKEFENLLRRLNTGGAEPEAAETKVGGFMKAGASVEDKVGSELGDALGQDVEAVREDTDKKKRKRFNGDDAADSEKPAKKSKQDKKKTKASEEDQPSVASTPGIVSSASPSALVARAPVRAHRARFMAANRQALNSGSAMDEILGISRSGTATPYPTTSIPETAVNTEDLKLQELTTSSKSVMDYFKEKLIAKSNPAASTSSSPKASETDDYDDRPRGGLGASRGIGARIKADAHSKAVENGTRSSTMFASASTSSTHVDHAEVSVKLDADGEAEADKKEKRKKEKERPKDSGMADSESSGDVCSGKKKKKKKKRKAEGKLEGSEADVEPEAANGHPEKKRKKKERGKRENRA